MSARSHSVINPKGMTFSDLGRMVLRNPASPMGAVVLRRVELAQWEALRNIDR